MLKHILSDLLSYFLPSAVALNIGLLAIEKLRRSKYFVWGNLLLLIAVISFSVATTPSAPPLQVEWAFYALSENQDSTYNMWTLLGDKVPSLLGIEDELGKITGLPTVCTADQTQMRIRLNRQGYVHVFHFDTTFAAPKRLFPTEGAGYENPIRPDIWAEFPPGSDAWIFDSLPGMEVFVVWVGTHEPNEVLESMRNTVEGARETVGDWAVKLETVHAGLAALAACDLAASGEYVHDLAGVSPSRVKTYKYQARDRESVLLLQLVQHVP